MASIQEKKRKKQQQQQQQPHPKPNENRNDEETLTLEHLKTLGHQLLSSRAHINNLPTLLSVLSPSSPLPLSLEALISLQSFFVPLVPDIPPKAPVESWGGAKDPELVYRAWLRERFDELVKSLIEIVVDSRSEDDLKDVALDAIMDFAKMGKGGRFNSAIYHRLLHSIVHSASSDGLLSGLLSKKYFNYIDVCYFTFTSLEKIAKDCDSRYMTDTKQKDLHNNGELLESRIDISVRIIYNILSCVPSDSFDKESSKDMWSQLGLSSKEDKKVSSNVSAKNSKLEKSKGMHNEVSSVGRITKKIKLKFTKAWLSFLRLPLPLEIYKEVLVTLHQNVIPYMANPAILCDFLTKSYDIGGVISVMALSGLFVLMTQHGLEYPKFYEKLYALLTPAVFMAKHRAVFFQLLDTCLKSSHLPAYLAAAFAKKMSRLALSVPPSGELVIVAIIHNLLRRHPSINFLVQKKQIDEEADEEALVRTNDSGKDVKTANTANYVQSKKPGLDPFKCEENDPSKCDAMRSSLWEIDTLRHHYCPAVSRFVSSLENDLTVRAKTSEVTVADFCSGSYATIFGEEIRRRIKQVPLAFYKVTPNSLFRESDFPGWSFESMLNNAQDVKDEENAVKTIEKDDAEPVKRRRVNDA